MDGEKHRCRCPYCKDSFDVFVTCDLQVHVASQRKGDVTSGTSQKHTPVHGEDRFEQGRDILREHAEERRKDKVKYPPNMPHDKQREDDDAS